MKIEEKIAESYFKSIGHDDIIFEPNGNRTPDFLINGHVAVEVRRLNQFYKKKPLEDKWYNVAPKIIKQIESFQKLNHTKSAFVSIAFRRPIKLNKLVTKRIDEILNHHIGNLENEAKYNVTETLEINIFPSEKKLETVYHLGSIADFDEGGFVLGNIYNSLKLIVASKSKITEPYKSDYKIWWLALIDNIGQGLSKKELAELSSSIDFDLKFDRIYIISNQRNNKGGYLENTTANKT